MIELKEFTKKFGSVTAVDAVSFQVEPGSIFGLVGSNGAGKSTLLRSICGVYAPDGGQVLLDGEAPYENPEAKGKVFFVSDYPYFMNQFALKDMADFFRHIYPNWSEEEYARLQKIFPLDPKIKIHNMSKGMQRQAALTCALATMPEYLLMDEVFDGLDPVMRQLLKRVISERAAERQMTVVIASHNLRELEDFCDHVGLIHKGGVVFEQELDELKLGIHKVQAVYRPALDSEALDELRDTLDIIKLEIQGSMVRFVARGSQEDFCDHVGLIHKGGVVFEQELDELKLGIHKVQAVYRPALDSEALDELRDTLDIIKLEIQGSMVRFVARGSQEEIDRVMQHRNTIFYETLPLSLEEVFISEMEAAGYDLDRILS